MRNWKLTVKNIVIQRQVSFTLDFEEIELVNTAFLNSVIGKLFDGSYFSLSKCNVLVKGMDETKIELITEAIRVDRQKYLRIRPSLLKRGCCKSR